MLGGRYYPMGVFTPVYPTQKWLGNRATLAYFEDPVELCPLK